jgi:hypothetical protein
MNTQKFYVFPHSVFVWISEQIAYISLYSINWLNFITKIGCVHCTVRTGSLDIFRVFLGFMNVNIKNVAGFWEFNFRFKYETNFQGVIPDFATIPVKLPVRSKHMYILLLLLLLSANSPYNGRRQASYSINFSLCSSCCSKRLSFSLKKLVYALPTILVCTVFVLVALM